ncbi:metal-dependent hydrolase [Natrinema salaciae]|uniref:LexA-binding, inner membrane-associated putative hydrolase n=1 Tax=Natrinema salaciae TaxID=1186196 RepID=A0A1H9SAR9_9EURY|nr:metal-dependent hydrolase [Natrinema salaciae]SER82102.1 LexA-binding, inner membrane-associated putative hydrolase [Natrinema salaciae]
MIAVPDVLTHVLVGYVVGTLLSIRYERIRRAHVGLVMIGALSPDFVKIDLVFPSEFVGYVLGVPFAWGPLHTLGGTLVVAGLGSLLFAPEYRRDAIALVLLGAVSHHVLDLGLMTPTGYSYAAFWPFTEFRPPAGSLYMSTDRWPSLVAGLCAVVVRAAKRRFESASAAP